ncbi:MAG TPA: hypothetical protein VKB38_09970 [Terracidiphilus sp.]|nr:hypothetical protein [Terracidiphilus sp.]
MRTRNALIAASIFLTSALSVTALAAQAKPAAPARPAPEAPAAAPALSSQDEHSVQRQLIDLLRISPTLTTVVAHDPSLLADTDYVQRNNPQLADFLRAHPEVVRNPDFYLFTHMNPQDGSPDEAIQREVWPDVYRSQGRRTGFDEFLNDSPPLLAFIAFLCAAIWGIRVFLENRRWSRIFKLQSDVHGRLIDKFSTNQELAAYMQTEAGRRFLEAAPIPLNGEAPQRIPNAVSRVLTPVQIGVVLVLLGVGFLLLRHAGPDYETPMLVLGVLILMPGVGFILSAGITWILAQRLGLMPPPSHTIAPYGSGER